MSGIRLWCAVCVLGVVAASSARGDERAAARHLFEEGSRHYDLGDYGQALELFKKAYVQFEEPSFLFNIAQCHRLLGDKKAAIQNYRTYLRKLPNASNADQVQRIVSELEDSIAREKQTTAPELKTPTTKDKQPISVEPPAAKPAPPDIVATPIPRSRPSDRVPAYKHWWPWTLAAVGIAAVAVGLGVGLTRTTGYPAVHGTDGTFQF